MITIIPKEWHLSDDTYYTPELPPLAINFNEKYYLEVAETTWFDEQDFWLKNKEGLAVKFCDLYKETFNGLNITTRTFVMLFCSLFEDYVNKEYKKFSNQNLFKRIKI